MPSNFKKIRIKDKKLMRAYHDEQCILCANPATPAHIKGRGAFGDDVESNMAPLCGQHHTTQGLRGMNTFANENPKFKEWLINNGWQFDEFVKKWRQYND